MPCWDYLDLAVRAVDAWGWIFRVLVTLLVIGTAIQLIAFLVDLLVG